MPPRGRTGPVKVNAVVRRGMNDPSAWTSLATSAEPGIAPLHRVMDVGATNGGGSTTSCPPRDRPRSTPCSRSSRSRPPTAARSRSVGATATARRDRRHLVGNATVLRHLHPCAHLRRGQALHLPLRRPRHRPTRAPAVGRDGRRGARAHRRGGTADGSLLRAPQRADGELPHIEMSYVGG